MGRKRPPQWLTTGGSLLVRGRQAPQGIGQSQCCLPFFLSSRPGYQVIGTDFPRPGVDLQGCRDTPPGVCVRSDEDVRVATCRQIRFDRVGIYGVVENEKDSFTLLM